jgi:hypothetical protein
MVGGWVAALAESPEFKMFLNYIKDEQNAVASSAMLGDGDLIRVSEARGEYKAYEIILNLVDIEGAE